MEGARRGSALLTLVSFAGIYDRADDLIARYKAGHMIGSHTYAVAL